MDKIIVNKDSIQFGDHVFFPPFVKTEIDQILGEPIEKEQNIKGVEVQPLVYVWETYGFAGVLADDKKYYESFMINMHGNDCHYKYLNTTYEGDLYLGKKLYKDCKWKDDYGARVFKIGTFECFTHLMEDCDKLSDKVKDAFLKMTDIVEVCYEKQRKLVKYKYTPIEEPELTFSDFNFKLAVIQRLMYEKELLQPKFDVYEFVEEYPKREIDIIDEGDDPIKEVINWFKKLQIPKSLADEVDEIHMDGGNDIYLQIIPYWDGEDNYFDIKKLTSEDLAQFNNLKKMTVMSEKYNKIAKILEEHGIEAKSL